MSYEEFEKLVQEAIVSLPENIRKKMDNVEIVVERGSSKGPYLGLYQGVPKTAWGRGFGMRLPDKITIFQKPVEDKCPDDGCIKEEVRRVVQHEIAHHFGISDDRLRELGEGAAISVIG